MKKFSLDTIVQILQTILPQKQGPIALHEPYFKGNEWIYIKECLDTGWVSSIGPHVNRFEKLLAEYTGVQYAVAFVNGTAALHTCLRAVGVSSDDEILIPALTFIATANAVKYCGAIPHFVDVEARTLGLDPHKLDNYLQDIAQVRPEGCINKISGRFIKAVVPMHCFGQPVDMDPLLEVCKKFKLTLIEDAAESLGSYYKGYHTGSLGQASILSFNGNKIITTGGGGAILTNEKNIFYLVKHLSTQAKLPHKWLFNHDMIGYNYRMPNINAALGCAQLEQLPEFIKKKRALALQYQKAFAEVHGLTVFKETGFAHSNYWLNVLLLDKEYAKERDNLLELTNSLGISTRPAWTLIHQLPMYKNFPRMGLEEAESLESRIINIPSSVFLAE